MKKINLFDSSFFIFSLWYIKNGGAFYEISMESDKLS